MEDDAKRTLIANKSQQYAKATKLTQLQAEIFVAKWYLEMSSADIGRLLGKTAAHVRVQLRRVSVKMDADPMIGQLAKS